MSTYQPPDLMSSGSPADDCWAISDWYRDRGDLTRAQDWANAAQRAEEFEDNNEWSAQRLAELATKPYLTQRALAMFNGSVELARAGSGPTPNANGVCYSRLAYANAKVADDSQI